MKHTPKVIVSVTSDLITDQRVHRSCLALKDQGFEVLLVGRKLEKNIELNQRPYSTKRFQLLFNKGPLFYANYNIRLFLFLVFTKSDFLFANDLDSLPANYAASIIKGKPLVYDSHEYYTGVPELENRPMVKNIWKMFERFIFPKLNIIITVNDSIANLYEQDYNKKLIVIRNVPLKFNTSSQNLTKEELRTRLNLPLNKNILILQGAGINVERGSEEAVEALRFIDNTLLIILGGGDVLPKLKSLVTSYELESKILFVPKLPYEEMMVYTMACDMGLSFDKDTNLNYRFSLPNKIFDYIHAGIPILASRLPEVEKIITGYKIGDFIENHHPESIAKKITAILNDKETFASWKNNLQIASTELNWETEVKKFPNLMNELH